MEKKSISIIIVIVLVVAGLGGFLGYEYTHPASTNLPKMDITALTPLNALDTYELGVYVSDFKALGLPVALATVTSSTEGTYTTPQSTPQFMDLAWYPDWPDPIAQQLYPMTGYANGGAFAANLAWTTNSTLNSTIALSTAFLTNLTTQMKEFVNLYHIFYDQYDYFWMPDPSTYFFVQPYINNFTFNPYESYFYNMMSYNMSYASHGIKAPTTNTLTDLADGGATPLAAPDYLDPAHGFYVQDEPLFTSVFQELYELNGSIYNQVVPVLASGMPVTPQNGIQYENYNISLRSGITFSNGNPVNASTFWFSLYRTIVMAQGVSVDNYGGMLFNASAYSVTSPYSIPVGWLHALRSVANTSAGSGIKLPYPSNYSNLNISNTKYAADYLAGMLSHYDPWSNTTQAALVSYGNQAVSVPAYSQSNPGNLNLTINLDHPYSKFLQDVSIWWGGVVDPSFIDAHDGVIASEPNNYTDFNAMPGTGPYNISAVGVSLNSISLTAVSNYWGNKYWDNSTGTGIDNFPAVAQPAHIGTIIMDYTVSHSGRVSGFLDNTYQISRVSSGYISSINSVAPYNEIPTSEYFINVGSDPAVFYISMNNYKFPTNILDFREALWYSVNQTALDSAYYYNGTYLAENYIGPASPNFANFYDNATKGLLPETYNISLAEYYLNLAGQQGKFYVTLPNGTRLGDVALAKSIVLFSVPGLLTMNTLIQNLEATVAKLH